MQRYRSLRVEPKEDARAAAYPAATYTTEVTYPFGSAAGESVPLEEYDFGAYHR
jgi:DNA-directed RNA polymerase subunit beta'